MTDGSLNLLEKFSKDDLKRAYEYYKQNRASHFFTPTGSQERFIQLVQSQTDTVYIFSAANRVGKTSLVVNILANLIWGPQNNWFDYDFFKSWPYPKRARFITDPKLVEEIGPLHSEITKYWPKGKYEAIKSGKQYYSQYRANGWVLDVMSYDQDVRQFEGVGLGITIFDEPPPESIWHASITRLMTGGLALVLMTPLSEAAWFYDRVLPQHSNSVIYCGLEDACKSHGVRGFLEHDQIQKIISLMDPEEVEARVHGKAMYLAHLIYKNFDYSIHVAKTPISVPENAEVWNIVDPHIDKPFAMIWGYPRHDGTFVQVAEWPNEDFYRMRGSIQGLEEYRKIIYQKEQGWKVTKRIIDRHFAEKSELYTRKTLREELVEKGLNYEPSYSSQSEVETGIIKVRSYLNYDAKKPMDSLNKPRYIVNPSCTNTIRGFLRWSYDKDGKPKDEYKDFMDCVRYALMASPKVTEELPAPAYKKLYG